MLADARSRARIVTDLDSTMFVEAGAGSGKTAALVDRVLALIEAGVDIPAIAAITFTDKAAAELRDRIRSRLSAGASDPSAAGSADLFGVALADLDNAAIGTLHSFAQTILTTYPVDAGLPPAVEVLDEVTSGVEFERRWADFRDRMLADPDLERPILLLTACGVRFDALRLVALAFGENWDLVSERVPASAPAPPAVASLLEPVLDQFESVCAMVSDCVGADKLKDGLLLVAEWVAAMRTVEDEVLLAELIAAGAPAIRANVGQRARWRCDVDAVRAALASARDALDGVKSAIAHACVARLGVELRAFTIGAAADRRAAGRLEFHDLLVLARALVSVPSVSRDLHRRYQRILLDEFQDTDPIQIDLASAIASSGGSVVPGRLFIVGDPKQSIYRFRRADIGVFLAARAEFGADGGLVTLVSNFRTAEPVIGWINSVFGRLMEASDGQPSYLPVTPTRPAPASGPPVALIGRHPSPAGTPADDLRAAEAADVVAAVSQALADGWTVGDDHRPCGPGDITVLVPTRTSLPFLEDAFEAAGISCRTESSSLVYASRAVRDLLMVLRAVDDPTDYLRVVSALRTPLLGCGDDDLFRHRVEHGLSFSCFAPVSGPPSPTPVAAGLALLRTLHEQRRWVAPSELLTRIAVECRAFELGFAHGRARDVWRRLRFVIDQARAWSDATHGTLREYLQWVDQQSAEGARVAEALLPETDDDAVRIMTIHAAKGLEFPIVILSGMSTEPRTSYASAQVVFPPAGGVGYRLGRGVTTPEYDEWKPIDEQMSLEERIRLLYVACTRARDHLVVSVRRKDRPAASVAKQTNAELLVSAMDAMAVPDVDTPALVLANPPVGPAPLSWSFAEWEAERAACLAAQGRPTTVAATALTADGTPAGEDEPDDGLKKRPRDLDGPPWHKGRYGSAIGRAVHGVLQTVDLVAAGSASLFGAATEAAVAAQCEAEAIPDRVETVTRLVSHALAAPSVREAARRAHWREIYACTPLDDGRLLEGYVDLLFRGASGLVVVDYKTSSSADPTDLDERVEGYRLQGASYALAVAAATGEPVVRVVFLFLTPEGAVERELTDLDRAIAEVRRLAS